MVEYVFDDVSDEILPHLPSRVREAVEHLVGADELPSDAAVRSRVFSEGDGESVGGTTARVRILLSESTALDLALHRSFEEGGNVVRTRALSADELHRLTTRSAAIRVRRTAQRVAARHRRPRRRRRSSPVRPVCAICLDTVRYPAHRLFLDCAHVFHRECIVEWLQTLPRKCPTCRETVDLTPRDGDVPRPRTRAAAPEPEHTSEGVEVCL